jgi:putative membrane protein
MPFAFVGEFGYVVTPMTVLTFYVLASLELIAEEIEDPFGVDENDLPLADISKNIKKSVTEIFFHHKKDWKE